MNLIPKKTIVFDERAFAQIQNLETSLRDAVMSLITTLGFEGRLDEPDGKKLTKDLYEIRVRKGISVRVIYAYFLGDRIVILHMFQKTSQKTPLNELKTALKRLKSRL